MKFALIGIALAIASSGSALAETVAPDGAPVSKETYPAELASRPLTLPAGMISLSAMEQVEISQDATQGTQWALAAAAAFGVTNRLELGLSGIANVGGVNNENQIGGYGAFQFTRNLGLRAAVNFDSIESVNGSSPSLSNSSSGTTTIQSSNSQTLTAELGAPLKFKLPHVPIAFGGLDGIVDVFFPIATSTVQSDYVAFVTLQAPVYVQFSPFSFLSVQGRVAPQFPIGAEPVRQVKIAAQVDVLYTRPHFDAGISGSAVLIDDLSGDLAGWQPTVFRCLATMTLRI